MSNISHFLTAPYQSYQKKEIGLEVLAVIFGITSVVFSNLGNIWVFPTGIVSTLLFVYLLYRWGLFGDMLINVYYTIMSVYGWILWASNPQEFQPEYMESRHWQNSVVLFIGSFIFVLLVYFFRPYIKNRFRKKTAKKWDTKLSWIDYVDCFTTSVFLVGMYTMAEMKVESWWFWLVGNFVSIIMYLVKKHAITSFQFLIFFILAITGYLSWLEMM